MNVNLTCRLRSPEEVAGMLFGLQKASEWNLRRCTYLPPLYRSGVVYQMEPDGREQWQLPEETYELMEGDCEDLASWRAAELVVSGEDPLARAFIRWIRPGLMHCLVLRADGSVEDPSKLLGMKGPG